jgi:hypothetical protein
MPPPAFRPAFTSIDALSCFMMGIPDSCASSKKPAGPCRLKFTEDEDIRLRALVSELGEANWSDISRQLGTRSARQCRERFKNYLSPNLKNEPWTDAEDKLLTEKFKDLGPKWSMMVSFFPTRSEVNLKNRWTQLSNRSYWEVDVEREKRHLIQALDHVIAGAAVIAPPDAPLPPSESSPGSFGFESIDWDECGRSQIDFFDFTGF